MVKSITHGGQEPQLQKIFLTLMQLILLTMMQVKNMIPERQERELPGICNFLYSVAAFLPVFDGKEHD